MTHENKLKPCRFCGGQAAEGFSLSSAVDEVFCNNHWPRKCPIAGVLMPVSDWNAPIPTTQPDQQFSNYQTDGGI